MRHGIHKEDSQKSRLTHIQHSQQIGMTEPDQGRSRAISNQGGLK